MPRAEPSAAATIVTAPVSRARRTTDDSGAARGLPRHGHRRTYDIFAAHWPHQEGDDDSIATLFNRVPKYVASRGRPDLAWAGSTQLGPDLPAAVREIRDRHEDVKVVGSLDLVQTLLHEHLVDTLDLWVHPIVLGVGKKLFDGGEVPTNLTLLEPPVSSEKGIVHLRYALAEGTPGTGDMTAPDRGSYSTGG